MPKLCASFWGPSATPKCCSRSCNKSTLGLEHVARKISMSGWWARFSSARIFTFFVHSRLASPPEPKAEKSNDNGELIEAIDLLVIRACVDCPAVLLPSMYPLTHPHIQLMITYIHTPCKLIHPGGSVFTFVLDLITSAISIITVTV